MIGRNEEKKGGGGNAKPKMTDNTGKLKNNDVFFCAKRTLKSCQPNQKLDTNFNLSMKDGL